MNKQNKIIVGVITLILALTIGYAVFTQNLNINGTATAKGEFGLIFENSNDDPTCIGFSGECTNSKLYSITEEGRTLNITVDKLDYPTAYVTIPVTVKNIGTVDAELQNVNINVDKNRDDIAISYTGVSNNEVLKANEQRNMVVRVEWKDTSSVETAVVTFAMSLSYAQKAIVASSSSSGGSTGGNTGETEDWVYKVNPDGLITAYNYAHGTDVVVPAEVDGTPVKSINQQSFMQPSNVTAYQSEAEGKMYMIIDEEGENYTVVKNKLVTMLTGECGEDEECANGMKSMVYICSSNDSCYNLLEEENGTATKVSIPDNASTENGGKMMVSTDPDLSAEESMMEPGRNISTLDLSKASNLTSIGDEAFTDSGLTSVNFGENSKLETIGNSAFLGNQISSLTIPNSITSIGIGAFSSNQISSLTFEENSKLETIDDSVFYGNQISSLTLPNSVTTIGNYAFQNNQMSSLTLSSILTTIGDSAFSNNQISGELVIPSNLTAVGESAFNSNQISSLTIPSNLTTIGNNAFAFNQISNLTIPKTVTSLGSYSFGENPIEILSIGKCTTDICYYNSFGKAIKELTVESGEIGEHAFSTDNDSSVTKIEKLTLGEEVTSIGNYAFSYNQISSLTIPNGVTTIGDGAFDSNQISGKLVIPSSVTVIERNAFYNNQISNLTIPKTVTSLGSSSFSENPIEILSIGKCTTDICSSHSFGATVKELTIESGEIGGYAFSSSFDSTTKLEKLTLGEGVTSIGYGAFQDNQISSLTIPNGVTTIGDGAFDSNQISNLTIPKSVTSLGSSSFGNNPIEVLSIGKCTTDICSYNSFGTTVKELTIESGEIGQQAFYSSSDSTTKLEKLTLGEEVTSIGERAFSYNQISGELVIPNSVTTIRNDAFVSNQISNLTFAEDSLLETIGEIAFYGNQISGELAIPNSVTTIGNSAFGKNQISNLTIPNSVTAIGNRVFSDNQISSLALPNSVTSIGSFAFVSNQISSLTIPNSVITIEVGAFQSNQISSLTFAENSKLETIGNAAFWANPIGGDLAIPDGVTSIGNSAFDGNQISNLTIPNSVTSIGKRAFDGNQISNLTIPNSVTTIGDRAFYGNSLTSILIKRTEEDFTANVTVGTDWYATSNNPTITYEP